jgi:hypothetical protein
VYGQAFFRVVLDLSRGWAPPARTYFFLIFTPISTCASKHEHATKFILCCFQVTIETLRLLQCLLEKPVENILDSLLLKHLADRSYFKQTTVVNGVGTQVNGDVNTTSRDEDIKVNELDRIELEKIVNRSVTQISS